MKKIIACISIICYTLLCYSQNQTTDNNYRTQKNISYLHPGEKDSYKLERCKLDLHYPTDKKDLPPLSGSTAEDWKPEKNIFRRSSSSKATP